MKLVTISHIINKCKNEQEKESIFADIAMRHDAIFRAYYQSVTSAYTNKIINKIPSSAFENYWKKLYATEKEGKPGYNSIIAIENCRVVGVSSTLPVDNEVLTSLDLSPIKRVAKLDKIYLCESLRGRCLWQGDFITTLR